MNLGLGLIGTGFIGKPHAFSYRNARAMLGPELPNVNLAMVCDEKPGHADQFADQFGFAKGTRDWRELVESPDVDIVVVATPNALHHEMATAALKAGKHVHCEKPMSISLEQAKDMAEVASKAKGRTMVGYNYLFNPMFIHAQKLASEGAIGRITNFRGWFDEEYRADETLPWSWRDTKAAAGLGTLADLGCHLVSQMNALLGPVESVIADIQTVYPERDDGNEKKPVENDDVASALLRFESGVQGSIFSSRTAWGRKCKLGWELHGSEGMLAFDQERMNELQLFQNKGPVSEQGFTTIQLGPEHPPYSKMWLGAGLSMGFHDLKMLEVASFLEALKDDRDGSPNFAQALEFEKVIYAIAEAANTQSRVRPADL